MSWKFNISEESTGQYRCQGMRDTGHTVKAICGESEIGRVFALAFDLELKLGTIPSRALFEVTKGAKPKWSSRYYDHAFGSWLVEAQANNNDRVVYDGKECWLEIHGQGQEPAFQSPLGGAKELDRAFFDVLASDSV